MHREIYGIFGGMGSAAGIDFANKLIKNNKDKCDQEHVSFVLFNITNIPDRPTAINAHDVTAVLKEFKKIILKMEGAQVTKIIIACNTAHYFIDDLRQMTSIPIIDVILNVSNYINTRNLKYVGLLGTDVTTQTGLYARYIDNLIIPSKDNQTLVMESIYEIKSGNYNKEKLNTAVANLLDLGAKTIILGCSELPLVLQNDSKFIDPFDILAKDIVNEHNNSLGI